MTVPLTFTVAVFDPELTKDPEFALTLIIGLERVTPEAVIDEAVASLFHIL